MSKPNVPISVNILDREYRIACREGEQEALYEAARFLNEQMCATRDSGIIGGERIAVMAALNLASELLVCRNEKVDYTSRIGEVLMRVQHKLGKCTQGQ